MTKKKNLLVERARARLLGRSRINQPVGDVARRLRVGEDWATTWPAADADRNPAAAALTNATKGIS